MKQVIKYRAALRGRHKVLAFAVVMTAYGVARYIEEQDEEAPRC